MRRRGQTALVAALLVLATMTVPRASSAALIAAPVDTRAMWLWGTDPVPEVIAWATQRNISEIFVYVSPTVLTDGSLARLQDLQEQTVARKIKLRALSGDPEWVNNHAEALAWQQAVVSTGIFDGIHLDVEPYLTTGWTTDLQQTAAAYLELLDQVRLAGPLQLEVDVPFWFGQYEVGGDNLADEVLRRVDAVTVMSYRDTATGPNSLVEVSQDWLARGAAAGKRVRLAAETGPLADCGYCTFHDKSASALALELSKVDTATRPAPAFGGIAVHHYGAWRTLPA